MSGIARRTPEIECEEEHADEESLLRTPPNEEEGFHQSLSTEANSHAQHEVQQCHQKEILAV